MTSIHQIAGRLRLKFPQLKNRVRLGRAVEKSIRGLPTVRLVQANTVTGSLLIHYEARGVQQANLLETIQNILSTQFGLSLSNRDSARNALNPSPFHGNPIADRVVEMIIEKIAERSTLALIGFLI